MDVTNLELFTGRRSREQDLAILDTALEREAREHVLSHFESGLREEGGFRELCQELGLQPCDCGGRCWVMPGGQRIESRTIRRLLVTHELQDILFHSGSSPQRTLRLLSKHGCEPGIEPLANDPDVPSAWDGLAEMRC